MDKRGFRFFRVWIVVFDYGVWRSDEGLMFTDLLFRACLVRFEEVCVGFWGMRLGFERGR